MIFTKAPSIKFHEFSATGCHTDVCGQRHAEANRHYLQLMQTWVKMIITESCKSSVKGYKSVQKGSSTHSGNSKCQTNSMPSVSYH